MRQLKTQIILVFGLRMGMTQLPARLKAARKMMGISQMALGVAAGIDENSASARMNQYERGVHVPDIQIMTNIAKALNVPVAYFYADNDLLAQLLVDFHRLGERDKSNVIKLISELRNSA